jgi:hypothetical protein
VKTATLMTLKGRASLIDYCGKRARVLEEGLEKE